MHECLSYMVSEVGYEPTPTFVRNREKKMRSGTAG